MYIDKALQVTPTSVNLENLLSIWIFQQSWKWWKVFFSSCLDVQMEIFHKQTEYNTQVLKVVIFLFFFKCVQMYRLVLSSLGLKGHRRDNVITWCPSLFINFSYCLFWNNKSEKLQYMYKSKKYVLNCFFSKNDLNTICALFCT